MGRFAVKLDYGGEEKRKRRGGDPWYASSECHPERRGDRDADRKLPAKGLLTEDINATTNGGSR